MSEYQQPQAGWEWRDQEDEHWYAENISDLDTGPTKQELLAVQPIIDQMLSQFDSIFGQSKESNHGA